MKLNAEEVPVHSLNFSNLPRRNKRRGEKMLRSITLKNVCLLRLHTLTCDFCLCSKNTSNSSAVHTIEDAGVAGTEEFRKESVGKSGISVPCDFMYIGASCDGYADSKLRDDLDTSQNRDSFVM